MINNNVDDPLFDPIRDLNKKGDHLDDLVLEGVPSIQAAIENGFIPHTLFTDQSLEDLSIKEGTISKVVFTTRATLTKVAGFPFHRHAIALLKRPTPLSLDDLELPALFLNGVTSPENVGSITRTCVAFGIKSLIFDYSSCSPYIRRCARVSMGNCFRLKVIKSELPLTDLKAIKNKGAQLVSFELAQNSTSLQKTKLEKNSVLIFGSEGHGVEQGILEISDKVVKIAMSAEVGSLNVSQSAAIALYQHSLSY